MEQVTFVVSPSKQTQTINSIKQNKTIPSIFKPNINPKRLETTMFNPVKRRLLRMLNVGKSSEPCKSKQSLVGFKGSRVLKSRCHTRAASNYEQILHINEIPIRRARSPQSDSKSKFIYNLSLYQKKPPVAYSFAWNDKQNRQSDTKYLTQCLIRKDRKQTPKLKLKQNGFDIQSIPATIQPRVLCSNLQKS